MPDLTSVSMAGEAPRPRRRLPAPAALLALLHPGPSLATTGTALAFMALLAGGWPSTRPLLLVAGMVLCQQFSISLHNDWCDRGLDAAAKPWRAIPSGVISADQVRLAAGLLALGSLVLAAPLGRTELMLDLVGLAAGFAYNARLKRTVLSWLPFAVAFPLLPLFGAAALGSSLPGWGMMAVAMQPAILAIHLADSLPDVDFDAAGGSRGLAQRLGRTGTRRVSLWALGAAAGLLVCAGWLLPLMGGPTTLAHARPAMPQTVLVASLVGAGGLLAVLRWPAVQRLAVTTGAAAVGVGWVVLAATFHEVQ